MLMSASIEVVLSLDLSLTFMMMLELILFINNSWADKSLLLRIFNHRLVLLMLHVVSVRLDHVIGIEVQQELQDANNRASDLHVFLEGFDWDVLFSWRKLSIHFLKELSLSSEDKAEPAGTSDRGGKESPEHGSAEPLSRVLVVAAHPPSVDDGVEKTDRIGGDSCNFKP